MTITIAYCYVLLAGSTLAIEAGSPGQPCRDTIQKGYVMNMSRTTIGLFILTTLFVLGLPARLVNGQMYEPTDLGTLGGNDCEAYALNNYGQVVGRSHNIEALTHAFHWQNEELLNLNQEVRWGRRLMQLDYGVAYDISDTDHVVGSTQCTDMLPP